MKTLLGFALSGLAAVWIGCSSDSSPVSPSASKALTDDQPPLISDAYLEAAVRASLPVVVTSNTRLTESDLALLTVLRADNKGIASLSGLEHAVNLESLWLENNRIPATGYSPLASLTKLKLLRIGGHTNGDIGSDSLKAVVASMHDLENLKVNHMGLTDIAFLEKLTKLSYVNLNSNLRITSFKPLTCLPNLGDLRVQNTGVAWRIDDVGEVRVTDAHIQYLIDRGDVSVRIDPSRGPVSTW